MTNNTNLQTIQSLVHQSQERINSPHSDHNSGIVIILQDIKKQLGIYLQDKNIPRKTLKSINDQIKQLEEKIKQLEEKINE